MKELNLLDSQTLREYEFDTYCELQSSDAPGEWRFDTPFWNFGNPDRNQYYSYKGSVFANYEINYYGIGMYEAQLGDSLEAAIALAYAWKLIWYHETPNSNTLYWLAKGYYGYQHMNGH